MGAWDYRQDAYGRCDCRSAVDQAVHHRVAAFIRLKTSLKPLPFTLSPLTDVTTDPACTPSSAAWPVRATLLTDTGTALSKSMPSGGFRAPKSTDHSDPSGLRR